MASPKVPGLISRVASKLMFTPEDAHKFLTTAGLWCWPMHDAADGRHATISDGWHPKGDKRFRNGAGHRGVDIMYWRGQNPVGVNHPWQSRGFEIIPGTKAVAPALGVVTVAKRLRTGFVVSMDHGSGVETAHHHLSALLVKRGDVVAKGQPVGVVGGSPIGYGLVHLHFDLVVCGKFVDAGPYLKKHWAYSKPTSTSQA